MQAPYPSIIKVFYQSVLVPHCGYYFEILFETRWLIGYKNMLRKHYIGFQHYNLWYPDTSLGNSNGSMWHIHKIGQGTHCDERGGMRDGIWRLIPIPVSVSLVTGAGPPDWGKNIPINFVSAIFVCWKSCNS
jgi:hypothetical protein